MAGEIAEIPCRRGADAGDRGAGVDQDADIEIGAARARRLDHAEEAALVQVAFGFVGQPPQRLARRGAGGECRD